MSVPPSPSISLVLQFLFGDNETFLGETGYVISSAYCGCALGFLPGEYPLLREAARSPPD